MARLFDHLHNEERYKAHRLPQTFLYLRTSIAIEHCDDLIESICSQWTAKGWNDVIHLLRPKDGGTWKDGLVIGTPMVIDPEAIRGALEPALTKFREWMIINLRGECCESSGGMISSSFQAWEPLSVFQIFLAYENDQTPERGLELLRKTLGEDRCVPIFWFRDGRILLFNSPQPAATVYNRLRSKVQGIDFVCGADSDGDVFTIGWDGPIWEVIPLEYLTFDPP